MQQLSAAGRLAAWGSAALAGACSLDDAVDAVTGPDDPGHRVLGLPGEDDAVTLAYALGRLRRLGATGLRLVLPRPGDASGLPGPKPFTDVAVERGEAVVSVGAMVALLPAGRASWQAYAVAADPRTPPTLREAQRELEAAVREAASALASLDVARWDPAAAEVLTGRSRALRSPLPAHAGPDAHALLAQAMRLAAVAELAQGSDGGAISASTMTSRREALRGLADAARHAVEAASSAPPIGT